jgi:hypothetical protein
MRIRVVGKAYFSQYALNKLLFVDGLILSQLFNSKYYIIQMANKLQKNYPAEADFPDLTNHNNWMAQCLTPEIYAKLRDKATPSGFTVDAAIQTGVDNPGK